MDASAILRLLDKEAGWERVAEILESHWNGTCRVEISAIQWGEIAGKVRKRAGVSEEGRALAMLSEFQFRIIDATADRAVRAAELKLEHRIGYADAFALELAIESRDRTLVTADYDFKAAETLARIEFLPSK